MNESSFMEKNVQASVDVDVVSAVRVRDEMFTFSLCDKSHNGLPGIATYEAHGARSDELIK